MEQSLITQQPKLHPLELIMKKGLPEITSEKACEDLFYPLKGLCVFDID